MGAVAKAKEWLTTEVEDEGFGRRLRRGMQERGWSVEEAALAADVRPSTIRSSLWGLGPWGAARERCRTYAVAGAMTPRWKLLVDIGVMAGFTVAMVPYAAGWGARRLARNDARLGGAILLIALAVIACLEAKEIVVPTTDEWGFRAGQVLVAAACGLLASGWITADMFTRPNRKPYRVIALAMTAGLPLLAFHAYVSDMYATSASAGPAMARYRQNLAVISEHAKSDPNYDGTRDTYYALKDLDVAMRLRTKSLADYQTFVARQKLKEACNSLPETAKPNCTPAGIDDPMPVDKWLVTRKLFQRSVPDAKVTSPLFRIPTAPGQPAGRWDSI